MRGFERALADNPIAPALGDVRLRYEPSMLVAETVGAKESWRPTALMVFGFFTLVAGLGWLLFGGELGAMVLLGLAGASIASSNWLSRHEKRKRGFVVNFATSRLRLDFATPIAGKPRTMLVPFDDVKALDFLEQGDGTHCLTIDFQRGEEVLREVLVAFIAADDVEAARRFERLLAGAFGLGSIPADSLFLAAATQEVPATPAHDTSTFEKP